MSEHKDMTHRHLRHKLQSLGRRLDELEEATNKLQKAEDELLELQDKIIQAEGSNSTLLSDVETLRKRLLKIQGKDEEVRKAEDLCRTVREKLEEEENLTKDLKAEIERLQRRMGDLEKLEEAFGKSKSDCSQLCLSLNEEKNQTKKLSSELEALKGRLKEMEGSETRLERAEQALSMEFEKLKGFTLTFMSDRKRLLEKQREDEKIILKLTEQLEQEKILGISADSGRADYERSRIEDELTSTSILTSKLAARKKSLDYLKLADGSMVNKVQNEKNNLEGSQEEDNKVKELTLEVEKLKNRLKQLEIVEEDLKKSESKNGELHEKFQMERNRTRQLGEQVEQLQTQLCGKGFGNGSAKSKVLENGKAENEEIISKVCHRQEKPKYQRIATVSEPMSTKQRNREMSPQHRRETKLKSLSEDSSPKGSKRPQSPLHKAKRTLKSPTVTSDNGLKETSSRLPSYSSMNASQKGSVLSRYPPAANDQKPTRSGYKQQDGDTKKLRPEKFSKLYVGSDSESNNSDIVADVNTNSIAVLEKDIASDQESTETIQDSSLSKANGSYTAYRSRVSPLLGADQGSEGHSSASETESTGSRPLEPEQILETTSTTVSSRVPTSRLSRYTHTNDSHSEGSSSRSSFDEELHNRAHFSETGQQGTPQTLSEIEIQRVCSPREALRSKAVIKPAIVEIDRKEMLISEPYAANGKPKISTKPVVTSTSKITSSITIYPNDPSSSRTSSRSSSLSSEPLSTKERHTSTSNFLIGPSSDHHGSISVPYEISIPKSDLTLRTSLDQDCEEPDTSPGYKPHNASTTTSHRCYQRNTFSLQSMDSTPAVFNDPESVFESSNSTAAVMSWRRTSQISNEDGAPDIKNVTVRSTWRNRGAGLAEEGAVGRARGGIRGMADGGSEDEAEVATWRAYRATTVDTEEALQRTGKPSPAEVYMRRINHTKDPEDPAGTHRAKRSQSPESSHGRTIPHAPVTSQSWGRAHTTPNMTAEAPESVSSSHSPASWRRPLPSTNSSLLGSSKTPGAPSSRAELWSRGQGSGARTEGRARPWNQRQTEHH